MVGCNTLALGPLCVFFLGRSFRISNIKTNACLIFWSGTSLVYLFSYLCILLVATLSLCIELTMMLLPHFSLLAHSGEMRCKHFTVRDAKFFQDVCPKLFVAPIMCGNHYGVPMLIGLGCVEHFLLWGETDHRGIQGLIDLC